MTGRERRDQLLAVGRSLFAERGYEATSVEEIAERAGVSKPLVYEHFGGKEGLYAVVVDREVELLLGMILRALDEAEHPREAVERAADAFLAFIEDERDGFRVLVRAAPVGTSRGSLPTVIAGVAQNAESILAREFRARGYRTRNAPLYARALVGMVALVGQWWLEVGKPKRQDVAAHLVNLAWNGLRALEPDPTRSRPDDERSRATRVPLRSRSATVGAAASTGARA